MTWRCLPPYVEGIDVPPHADQLHAQKVGGDVVQLLLGEALAGECQLQDGYRGGVVIDNQRRLRAGGQLAHRRLRRGRDLSVGSSEIRSRLEEDADQRAAANGGGLDVLDIIDGRG